jgi:hypothetical protein
LWLKTKIKLISIMNSILTSIRRNGAKQQYLTSIISRYYGGPVLESTEGYIDLRSDTVTRPTKKMKDAMAKAALGDDVYRDDPTMNRLESEIAKLFGK